MRKAAGRTAAAVLAGVLAAGMLTGCGEEKLDGTKTVATVNGTEIPMGVVSIAARQQQAQMDALYASFMGAGVNIWDTEADEKSGETYGEQAVKDTLKQVELMYIMKDKAADYKVEVTEEDEKAITEAAKAFMEANSEETIAELAVTEEQVKTYLELQTYRQRVYNAVLNEAEVEVTDEEANQSSFTYVSISTSGEELTEDDIKKKKEQAQEILDTMKKDPTGDMSEVAKAVDESYNALTGTFTTAESKEEDESSSYYPKEVLEVLRGLKEGEVAPEVIETDTSYYVVRLDKELDEEATESKRESLESEKKTEYYTETTDKWLEDAEIKADNKVLETLKITDTHKFTMKMPEVTEEPEAEAAETPETTETPEEAEEPEAEVTETPETTEAPEEAEEPETEATPEPTEEPEAEATPEPTETAE